MTQPIGLEVFDQMMGWLKKHNEEARNPFSRAFALEFAKSKIELLPLGEIRDFFNEFNEKLNSAFELSNYDLSESQQLIRQYDIYKEAREKLENAPESVPKDVLELWKEFVDKEIFDKEPLVNVLLRKKPFVFTLWRFLKANINGKIEKKKKEIAWKIKDRKQEKKWLKWAKQVISKPQDVNKKSFLLTFKKEFDHPDYFKAYEILKTLLEELPACENQNYFGNLLNLFNFLTDSHRHPKHDEILNDFKEQLDNPPKGAPKEITSFYLNFYEKHLKE